MLDFERDGRSTIAWPIASTHASASGSTSGLKNSITVPTVTRTNSAAATTGAARATVERRRDDDRTCAPSTSAALTTATWLPADSLSWPAGSAPSSADHCSTVPLRLRYLRFQFLNRSDADTLRLTTQPSRLASIARRCFCAGARD